MPRTLDAHPVLDSDAELAEGPRWDDRTDRLLWVDILRGELHAFDPARGRDELVLDAGRHLGAAAPHAGGDGFTLAVRDGVASPDVPFLADAPGLRSNDARPDRQGRLWLGVIAYDAEHGPTEGRGLYRLHHGATLYFADTLAHRVLALPFDGATGTLGEARTFLDLAADDLLPDGLCVDAGGGVWLGLYGAGQVRR